MFIGVGGGCSFPGLKDVTNACSVGSTNIPTAIDLILMMFPPLAKARDKERVEVFAKRKWLAAALHRHGFGLALAVCRGGIWM